MTPKELVSYPFLDCSRIIIAILSKNAGKAITALDVASIVFKKECQPKSHEYNIVIDNLRQLVVLGLLDARGEYLGRFGRKRLAYSVNEKTESFCAVITSHKKEQAQLRAKSKPVLTEKQEVAIYRRLITSVRAVFEKDPTHKLSASDVTVILFGEDHTHLQFLRCRGALGALCDTGVLFFDLAANHYRVKSEKDAIKLAEFAAKRIIGAGVSADRKRKTRKTA